MRPDEPQPRPPVDAGLERQLESASGAWHDEPVGERAARQTRLRQRLRSELAGAAEPPIWRLALVGSFAGAAGLLLGLFLSRSPEPSVEQWLHEWDELTDYVEFAATAESASPPSAPRALPAESGEAGASPGSPASGATDRRQL